MTEPEDDHPANSVESASPRGRVVRRETVSGVRRRVENFALVRPVESEVLRCRSTSELGEAVRTARLSGRRITLRGAGCSFHDQAQGDDLTVIVDLAASPLVRAGEDIVASGGATWGELFRFALAHGKLPLVAPTTEVARLAGAASSNSVSRFSPVYGKESHQIASFRLLDGTGRLRLLRRPSSEDDGLDAQLYRAAVGGFGGLGAIIDLTYRFVDSPFEGTPRMETVPRACVDESELVGELVGHYRRARGGTLASAWGISDDAGRAVSFLQRLVSPETPLDPLALHRPQSLVHRIGVALCSFPAATSLIHGRTHGWMGRRRRPFVDDLLGHQFMMDGSRVVRMAAQRRGVTMPLLQQSFVLPLDERSSTAGLRFYELMRRELRDRRIVPSVIDSMVVPADRYALSASRGMAGLMISPAIQLIGGRDVERVEDAFRAMSRGCADLGGRVHLTKYAVIEPDVMAQMYAEGMRRYLAARHVADPDGVFGSPFLDRLEAAAGQPSSTTTGA